MTFQPGNKLGKGARKNSKLMTVESLLKAIRQVEKERQIDWWKNMVERSLEDTAIAKTLIDRLLPRLQQAELTGGLSGNFRIVIDKGDIEYPPTTTTSIDTEKTGPEAGSSSPS